MDNMRMLKIVSAFKKKLSMFKKGKQFNQNPCEQTITQHQYHV